MYPIRINNCYIIFSIKHIIWLIDKIDKIDIRVDQLHLLFTFNTLLKMII